jgi:hypothetical protein
MKAAGATKENPIHWDGDSLFCAGMEIFEAIDHHFPGSTASGIIKNKHAGTPALELRAAAKSWDGRIRKAGFEMSALSHTSKGTPVMLVVSLFSEDGCNLLISSSGTTVPSKQLYQREWVDPVSPFFVDVGIFRAELYSARHQITKFVLFAAKYPILAAWVDFLR